MKECIKEAIDNFIYRLKQIAKLFKVKLEGGDDVSLLVEGADALRYKIICIDNMFNLDYTNNIPIHQDGKYSKWTTSTLDIIDIISEINNVLTRYSTSKAEILEYILYKENNLYIETIKKDYYLYAN